MHQNSTLDPALKSWHASANEPNADFPVQNLPLGVFRRRGSNEQPRVGMAIGDSILDIPACLAANLFADCTQETRDAAALCANSALNALMEQGRNPARALREGVSWLLASTANTHLQQTAQHALVKHADAEMFMPANVGDYTDFYASVQHASNVGALFRPDNPLLPNYKWVPIGYHGRASSIVVSRTNVRRPNGQRKGPNDATPTVGPSRALDYELELGLFVAGHNELGTTIPLATVDDHMFGLCLLNDWSARDVQSWEYQPLGPFLAKNFCSTISPWVVTVDALEPFRAPLEDRAEGDPEPLAYLSDVNDKSRGGFAITVEVWLQTTAMRNAGVAAERVTQGSALDLYWTFGQMLAHHASNGCNMRAGDLLGSGTISGKAPSSRGCLLELTRRGAEPVALSNGETRSFLEDGDEVILRAYAAREGAVRIGFGECRGMIVAAV
ncbi:MAG: fumarylacetoacetase [Gemmatimonadaceae bacterium]